MNKKVLAQLMEDLQRYAEETDMWKEKFLALSGYVDPQHLLREVENDQIAIAFKRPKISREDNHLYSANILGSYVDHFCEYMYPISRFCIPTRDMVNTLLSEKEGDKK